MNPWGIITVGVIAAEAYAKITRRPTPSQDYLDALHARPFIVGGATFYLLGHLAGLLPRRWDVLRRLG